MSTYLLIALLCGLAVVGSVVGVCLVLYVASRREEPK